MWTPRLSSEQLAVGLVFVVVAALACLAPAQGDTWWLLRAGQDIWTTGHVPLVETYSHSAAGRYWPNHEWLTEAVFYALHRVGGMPLLAAACAMAATGAWALAYSLTRGSFEARLVVLMACLLPAAMSFALRPQMFTMLLFAATCALLARDRLAWLPPVVLVWANFHGAVALGIVAVAGAGAVTVIGERRWPWALFWTGAACVLATLVTPMGAGLWTFWIESPARSEVNDLIEWRPPDLSPALWPFWGVAAVLPVVVVRNWRRLDSQTLRLAGIALGVLPLALQAVRNVPIFLLAALPALTCAIAAARPARTRKPAGENERLNGIIFTAAAAMAMAVVGLAWTRPPATLGWRPFTAQAASAVAGCPGPMFNTYVDGGALTWFVPSQPVFIDNRQDPYPMELLEASRRTELEGEHALLFERYGFRCAVLPPSSPIASGLARDPSWSLAYEDETWVVFERAPDRP